MRSHVPARARMCAAALFLCASVLPAAAQQVYGTGFEAPLFQPGSSSGQDGWTGDGEIYPTVVHSGAQALRLTMSPTYEKFAVRTLTDPIIDRVIDARVAFTRVGGPDDTWYGMEIDADNGPVATLMRFHTFFALASSNTLGPGAHAQDDTWHTLEVRMDFRSNTLQAWLDAASLGTLPMGTPGATTLTGVKLFLRNFAMQQVFFDDLSLTDETPVPAGVATWGRIKALYRS